MSNTTATNLQTMFQVMLPKSKKCYNNEDQGGIIKIRENYGLVKFRAFKTKPQYGYRAFEAGQQYNYHGMLIAF